MSVKDGLAAGLAWCWGGAAVAGALIAAMVRVVSAAEQPSASGDLSAFACGAAMVIIAFGMTVARYLFEARLQEADRSVLDPSRSLHANALAGIRRGGLEPLVLQTHPLNRLPRWLVVVLLGAGASIGSQVLSSLIWRLEWDLASSAQSLLCSPRGAQPFYTDPICGHPRDLLLRFTMANAPAYLGINTLAFFIVVYLLLPREGQSARFGFGAVALLFEKVLSKAAPGRVLGRPRRAARFVPGFRRVPTTPAYGARSPALERIGRHRIATARRVRTSSSPREPNGSFFTCVPHTSRSTSWVVTCMRPNHCFGPSTQHWTSGSATRTHPSSRCWSMLRRSSRCQTPCVGSGRLFTRSTASRDAWWWPSIPRSRAARPTSLCRTAQRDSRASPSAFGTMSSSGAPLAFMTRSRCCSKTAPAEALPRLIPKPLRHPSWSSSRTTRDASEADADGSGRPAMRTEPSKTRSGNRRGEIRPCETRSRSRRQRA